MITNLNGREPAGKGPVLYWMSRDQRTRDNRALEYSALRGLEESRGLAGVFCLADGFLGAPLRAYDFMLGGMRETAADLEEMGVPFFLLEGNPGDRIPAFADDTDASLVVTDFDPLKPKRRWAAEAARRMKAPLFEVDAHNIVPCREASDKAEFAARTLRPKITRLLEARLAEQPMAGIEEIARAGRLAWKSGLRSRAADWDGALRRLAPDASVPPPENGPRPGAGEARRVLDDFVRRKLAGYAENRNDPNKDALSGLSPYLHFGQISAREAVRAAYAADAPEEDLRAFVDEIVVRRELSDNFCLYNPEYDSVAGFPAWARKTLDAHRGDERPYLYGYDDLEGARTHEDLWNAAQRQLLWSGKMHGYLRMYWAKKILEWSPTPEEALAAAIRLNDRYSLDGRDPNGYAGCAWAVGGTHDRPWFERPVFGSVRYMNRNGAAKKFDADAYIARWS